MAFPLHPETPDEGRTLQELFAGRGVDVDQVVARLKRTADELSLPFTTRSMTYNSRRAQELGKWAEQRGRGDAFHHAAFEAYFAKGHNIADIEVLKEIVRRVHLNPDEAEAVLHDGTYQEAVDRDWQRCRDVGITAVPTFHMNGQYLVGAQPYEALERMVIAAGA